MALVEFFARPSRTLPRLRPSRTIPDARSQTVAPELRPVSVAFDLSPALTTPALRPARAVPGLFDRPGAGWLALHIALTLLGAAGLCAAVAAAVTAWTPAAWAAVILATLGGGWIAGGALAAQARALIDRFNVKAGGPGAAARSLSGGNLQKFIMGREIDAAPRVLIVAQPTWGVDVGAAAQIRAALLGLRDAGCAVLVVSEELDELFELSDRLVVIARGRVSPPIARADATVERIGEWMSGLWPAATATAEVPA